MRIKPDVCEQDPQLVLKECWGCYYFHPNLQTKARKLWKTFHPTQCPL